MCLYISFWITARFELDLFAFPAYWALFFCINKILLFLKKKKKSTVVEIKVHIQRFGLFKTRD
jgi:hypothetical protein